MSVRKYKPLYSRRTSKRRINRSGSHALPSLRHRYPSQSTSSVPRKNPISSRSRITTPRQKNSRKSKIQMSPRNSNPKGQNGDVYRFNSIKGLRARSTPRGRKNTYKSFKSKIDMSNISPTTPTKVISSMGGKKNSFRNTSSKLLGGPNSMYVLNQSTTSHTTSPSLQPTFPSSFSTLPTLQKKNPKPTVLKFSTVQNVKKKKNFIFDDDENEEKYHNAGVIGLNNLGNTCYMNSGIQCVSNIPILRKFLLKGSEYSINTKTKWRGELTLRYIKLLKKLFRPSSIITSVSAGKFKRIISKYQPMFYGTRQHDSGEFIKFFLDGLHEDLNRVIKKPKYVELQDISGEKCAEKSERYWTNFLSRNDSFISNIFAGQFKSELKCTKCHNISTSFDPFFDISLPIPSGGDGNGRGGRGSGYSYFFSRNMYDDKGYTIYDLYDKYTEEEKLGGAEKPYCVMCKKRRMATKRIMLYKCPKVMLVLLKRFNRLNRKLLNEIEFPVTGLDLSAYVDVTSCDRKEKKCVYNLIGVVNHIGSVYGGHYTAYAKNSVRKKWVYYNDSRVKVMGKVGSTVSNNQAYVLFYLRKDIYDKEY